MGKKIKIIIILIILILTSLYIISYLYENNYLGFKTEPCKSLVEIYNLNETVTSEAESKRAIINFLSEENIIIDEKELNVKESQENSFEIEFTICGSLKDIEEYPPEIESDMYPKGEETCANIKYKINGNKILGYKSIPC